MSRDQRQWRSSMALAVAYPLMLSATMVCLGVVVAYGVQHHDARLIVAGVVAAVGAIGCWLLYWSQLYGPRR